MKQTEVDSMSRQSNTCKFCSVLHFDHFELHQLTSERDKKINLHNHNDMSCLED